MNNLVIGLTVIGIAVLFAVILVLVVPWVCYAVRRYERWCLIVQYNWQRKEKCKEASDEQSI